MSNNLFDGLEEGKTYTADQIKIMWLETGMKKLNETFDTSFQKLSLDMNKLMDLKTEFLDITRRTMQNESDIKAMKEDLRVRRETIDKRVLDLEISRKETSKVGRFFEDIIKFIFTLVLGTIVIYVLHRVSIF